MIKKPSLIFKAGQTYKDYKNKEEVWRYGELTITLLAIAFFLVFAIRPTVRAISTLLSEIENKQELSLKMSKKINQVIAAQTNFSSILEEIDYLDEAYPQFPQLAKGGAQLVGLGLEKGLVVNSIAFSEVEFFSSKTKVLASSKDKEAVGVNYSASFSGDYGAVKLFLDDFLKIRRVFIVEGYSISISEDLSSNWVNISVFGLLPYFKN